MQKKLKQIRGFRFFYYYDNFPSKIESIKNEIILQNRKVLEYENNIFVKEYSNAKDAAKILNIKYTTLNNILTGKTQKCREYPNKTWIYVK